MNALHALVGFMAGLNNADADGRILLDPAAGTLKFLLLNAAAHFSKVSFALVGPQELDLETEASLEMHKGRRVFSRALSSVCFASIG